MCPEKRGKDSDKKKKKPATETGEHHMFPGSVAGLSLCVYAAPHLTATFFTTPFFFTR